MRWRLPWIALVALVVATLVVPAAPARADEPKPQHRANEVYWHDEWPKFRLSELLVSVAVTVHNFRFEEALDGPKEANVEFYVPLLDKEIRSLVVPNNESKRNAYARLSDLGYKTLVFAPYAVDVTLTLAVHRNPEVALQLFLIDFEVLTLAAGTQTLISRLIGRARPYVREKCRADDPDCGGGPYRSLLSGHTMAAFTAAGLMCSHHENLPIFGGGAPDTWACVWAVSLASMTGLLRLPADEHWTSDVLLGAGLGFFYGYYLPKLLHFQKPSFGSRTSAFTWMPSLFPKDDGGVLSISGRF